MPFLHAIVSNVNSAVVQSVIDGDCREGLILGLMSLAQASSCLHGVVLSGNLFVLSCITCVLGLSEGKHFVLCK